MGWGAVGDEASSGAATTSAYAEIHAHDENTPQEIAAGATYTKLTTFTDNGFSGNCTPDAPNNQITITKAGRYSIDSSMSFSSSSNNTVYNAGAFVGGVEVENTHFQRKVSTSGDVGSASACGFIEVTTPPVNVDLRINHDQVSAVSVTVTYINLNIIYIGSV